jgi:hypothetical protein
MEDLFATFSPDDLEDIIAFYLQDQGWKLIKSTCFRSKPKFEFSMIKKDGLYGKVQVKSSSYEQLWPSSYKDFINDGSIVYLFSRSKDPYLGESVERVIPISHDEIYRWIKENVQCLSLPIKTKLMIWAGSA